MNKTRLSKTLLVLLPCFEGPNLPNKIAGNWGVDPLNGGGGGGIDLCLQFDFAQSPVLSGTLKPSECFSILGKLQTSIVGILFGLV